MIVWLMNRWASCVYKSLPLTPSHQSVCSQHLIMRTSVLVASFALVAIALLTPAYAACASAEYKASDASAYKAAAAKSDESAESVKVADARGNYYEKSQESKDAAASTKEGYAANDVYAKSDAFGNKIVAKKSKKGTASTDVQSSSTSSVEKKVVAPPPCGCAK